jgi:hypothetical protein
VDIRERRERGKEEGMLGGEEMMKVARSVLPPVSFS